MAIVQRFFPTVFYEENDLCDEKTNRVWLNKLQSIKDNNPNPNNQWYGGTYTSHSVYDLTNDDSFSELIAKVTYHVNEFAKMHNSHDEYVCKDAFFNFSNAENFQEFHHHHGTIFSAVYYVNAPEGSGSIVFQNPNPPDMLPPKNTTEKNEFTFSEVSFPSSTGRLIIFRSNIRHCVTQGTNTEPRVSIAFNYA